MSPTDDTSHELVHIISLTGDEHDEAVESTGQDPARLVEHLSGWDYGEETDGAASVLGHTDRRDVEHSWTHPYHVIEHGALTYWLIADHPLRLLSLYRRPLDVPEQESTIEQLAPMIEDLSGPNPWVPGIHFHNHPELAQRLRQLIAENAEWLISGDRDHHDEEETNR